MTELVNETVKLTMQSKLAYQMALFNVCPNKSKRRLNEPNNNIDK